VNRLEAEWGDRLDVIYLNLLSDTGRETATEYSIRIVPATLLFGPDGELLVRHIGVPDATELRAALAIPTS
jgi:hemin uptake protein HemP